MQANLTVWDTFLAQDHLGFEATTTSQITTEKDIEIDEEELETAMVTQGNSLNVSHLSGRISRVDVSLCFFVFL